MNPLCIYGTLYTIEGNTSSATVSTNGGAVCAKSYSISNTYIVYVCCPNYTVPVEEPPVDAWRDVVFDSSYYASRYADARESCGSDFDKLYQHFKTYGIPEGRQASPNFDVKYYLANNPSVQNIIGSTTDYQAAYDYYIKSGYLEVALTAQHVDVGEHFYARLQMTPGKNLSLSDNNVILYSASELPAQIWEFIRQPDGSYKIVNAKYSLCLSVEDNARTMGANVITTKDTGDPSQRWFIYAYNGRYMFRPACSAYCALDIYGGCTDDLMNKDLTDAQRALVKDYDSTMLDSIDMPDAGKVGPYAATGGFSAKYPTVSLEGAFTINYYFNLSNVPDADVMMFYWTEEDYNSASSLSPSNASGKAVLSGDGTSYAGAVNGIAAQDLDDTIYVVVGYRSGGVSYCTGVLPYSIGAFCASQASSGTGVNQALAAAIAVYSYYAKAYFSIN